MIRYAVYPPRVAAQGFGRLRVHPSTEPIDVGLAPEGSSS